MRPIPAPGEAFSEVEAPLTGGLVAGRVVRVGETVRRPAGPWTATIHALLAHLRARGFPSPEPLGVDERGREVVSYLPGACSTWPWPPVLLAPPGCRQVGVLLRVYHRTAVDFVPPSPAIWRHGPQDLSEGQIVIHGDFGPHNLIWTGGALTGVIDFELARPGRPMEDAAFAAIRIAHLRPDDMASAVGFDGVPDRRSRLAAFADGYGCSPQALLVEAPSVQTAELERIERLGGAGLEPWSTLLAHGLAERAGREVRWLEENLIRLNLG